VPRFTILGGATDADQNFSVGGATRWLLRCTSAGELQCQRYDSGGTHLGAAFLIDNATGAFTASTGRVISQHPTGVASYTVWQNTVGAVGMWIDGTLTLRFGTTDGSGAPNVLCFFAENGKFQTQFSGAFKPGGGTWTDSSDARIKNVLGDYANGLDAIKTLRPVRYTFKGNDTAEGVAPENEKVMGDDGLIKETDTKDAVVAPYGNSPHFHDAKNSKEFIGLIAQECEAAFPEIVSTRAAMIDGQPVADLRDLDPNALTYALINAVKTLAARIEALEAAQVTPG